MELQSSAWLSIAAVVIVFFVCLVVSVCCRKKYLHQGCHKKKSIAGMIIALILWILVFIFFAWSWYWVITHTKGKQRIMFNWLFGLSLLSILLWALMFFVCGHVGCSLLILTLLIFLSVALAVQAGLIGNYWILAFEILFAIFLVIIAICSCMAYHSMGYNDGKNFHDKEKNEVEVKTIHKVTEKVEDLKTLTF
jgi:hypothetical protein